MLNFYHCQLLVATIKQAPVIASILAYFYRSFLFLVAVILLPENCIIDISERHQLVKLFFPMHFMWISVLTSSSDRVYFGLFPSAMFISRSGNFPTRNCFLDVCQRHQLVILFFPMHFTWMSVPTVFTAGCDGDELVVVLG